ncbi:MAG: hypothetical protein FJ098_07870 [Deltaproteobacteria bacterium]|nr:hypothetical protein [Deltaproteobacteria bacterium]
MDTPLPTRRAAAVLLLALAGACGEFRTLRFTEPRDSGQDQESDVLPDAAPRCGASIPLVLGPVDLTALEAGVPVFRLLPEDTGHGSLWLLTGGPLPEGLRLDPVRGALEGVPRGPFSGEIVVRVTGENDGDTCYALDEETYPLRVRGQCSSKAPCAARVAMGFLEDGGSVACGADRRCWVADGCPNDPRQQVRFLLGGDALPPAGGDGTVTGGEVIRHARIQGQKNPDDLRRQVLVLFEDADSAVIRLDYTLPGNGALPLAEGDPLALRLEEDPAGGTALRLDGPEGTIRLLQGLWIPGPLPPGLALPELAALLPLECPGIPDACGDRVPAAVTFGAGPGARTLTPSDLAWIADPEDPGRRGADLLVRLGWTAFRDAASAAPACAVLPALEFSALFLPAGSCPAAVIEALSPQDQVAGQALAAVPEFGVAGWASFSPAADGAIAAADWSVLEDPAGGGFARLEALPAVVPDPAGLGPRRLRAGAVGDYLVALKVQDGQGRESCLPDTLRFRVHPSPEVAFRAELLWLPAGPSAGEGEDRLDLLLRPAGSAPWDDPQRVCSPETPLPTLFEGAQCAAAGLLHGRPGLATLTALSPGRAYDLAVRAPASNTEPLVHDPAAGRRILLRIFCGGAGQEVILLEGLSLAPGALAEVARVDPGCVLTASP